MSSALLRGQGLLGRSPLGARTGKDFSEREFVAHLASEFDNLSHLQ